MPPKSKNGKGKQRIQSKRSLSSNLAFTASAHFVGRNVPYKLAQATSGVGCITTNNAATVGGVLQITIDPFTIGGRATIMADLFAQWRVRRLEIQYLTDTTASGVVNSQAGPGTTPSYGSRPFAMGWQPDPLPVNSTYLTIVEYGGFCHNTSRDSRVIKLPPSGWLWSATTAAFSASNIDLRMTGHGVFAAAFVDASTTAAATYGRWIWSYDLEFRYPVDTAIVGAQVGEVKDESTADSPLLVSVKEDTEEKSTASRSTRAVSSIATRPPLRKGLLGW